MLTCKLCSGPLALLGVLGMLRWFRCVNCGMDQNRRIRRRVRKVKESTE